MARLFAELEGGGEMLASVPVGMVELAERLAASEDLPDYHRFGLVKRGRKTRATFLVRPDAVPYIRDVRNVPREALYRDQAALREVLARIGGSGEETRALSRVEFDYLVATVGEGPWQRYLAFIGEEEG